MTSRHPAVSCACPKCQSERRTTPTPATEEREAVAHAIELCATPYISEALAECALSALAQIRAAEILAAEANVTARIVAWLRATSTGLDLTERRIADAIDEGVHTEWANEHGAGK